ncbi:MAG: STN domain-containing protein, partial [Armatimonadota bacterium]
MDWVRKPQLRLRSLSVLLLVSVVVTFSAVAVLAQNNGTQQDNDRVSISIFDTELRNVVQLLMKETKKNIMITDQDKLKNKVSVNLTDMPFETVLRYVAEGAGCDFKVDSNGVYVIGEKVNTVSSAPKIVTASNNDDNRIANAIDNEVYVAARSTKVEKIDLNNTSPSDMMWILGLYQEKDAPKVKQNKFKPGWFRQKDNGQLESIYEPNQVPGGAAPTMSDNPMNENTANRTTAVGEEVGQFGGGGFGGGGGNRSGGGGGFGGGNRSGGSSGFGGGGNTGGG